MTCRHCTAREPSVWDDVLWHYAHPHSDPNRLTFCESPWRERCRECSADPGSCVHTTAPQGAERGER